MPYEPVDVIEVRCWGSRVGAVALDERTGFYAFEYAPSWLRGGVELAPTTMPLTNGSLPFLFPGLPPDTYHRLPAMIADSLPDDFGNALTNAYMASQGIGAGEITSLDRLAYLGSRGVGALEFRPIRGPRSTKPSAVELSELVLAARSVISGNTTSEGKITEAIHHLIAVGTSAGGARAKAVVAWNPSTGELRSGQVPADPGFEQWLLKLDGVGPNLDLGESGHFGRIEFAYHLMAKDVGIEIMPSRLLEEGGRAHFMTKRFDRSDEGHRIHTQTLCAMSELDYRLIGAHDYAQLFILMEQLGLGPDARAEAFRRMVFNVAAANCDDHTKNFSFALPEGEGWRLAPAYDVTHAHAPSSKWTRQHLMAVNGRVTGIGRDDVNEVADRFSVPSSKRIVEDVSDVVADWPSYAAKAGVPSESIEEVSAHIAAWSGPLRRERG